MTNILAFRKGTAREYLDALASADHSDRELDDFSYAGLTGEDALNRVADEAHNELILSQNAKRREQADSNGYLLALALQKHPPGPAEKATEAFDARILQVGYTAASAELRYAGLQGEKAADRLHQDAMAEMRAGIAESEERNERLRAQLRERGLEPDA